MDQAEPEGTPTVFGVPVDGGVAEPTDLPLGLYSSRGGLLALPGGSQWLLAQPDGSAGWALPAAAVNFRISPNGAQVAWTEGSRLPVNVDRRQRTLWVADVDGTRRQQIARLTGGDLVGWAEMGDVLLVTGTPAGETLSGLWRVGLDGATNLLMDAGRPRGLLQSPAGGWLAFLRTFTGEPALDGLWILPSSGGEARRLDFYGSYRWRQEGRLMVIPYPSEGDGLSLVEVDAASGTTETLLASGALPGALKNNDWALSPDGRWIVYLNAADGGLWLAALP